MLRARTLLIAVAICFTSASAVAEAPSKPPDPPLAHTITLRASTLPSGQMAYEMVSHKVKSPDGQERDITALYATGPTIPGPTLVLKEGDTAEVTLVHGLADSPQPVSIHVHGVHYKIDSDGT
jgi:manganese oxidase